MTRGEPDCVQPGMDEGTVEPSLPCPVSAPPVTIKLWSNRVCAVTGTLAQNRRNIVTASSRSEKDRVFMESSLYFISLQSGYRRRRGPTWVAYDAKQPDASASGRVRIFVCMHPDEKHVQYHRGGAVSFFSCSCGGAVLFNYLNAPFRLVKGFASYDTSA